jgi:amino acid transporter
VLACATAAARVLMRMARGGLLPRAIERTSRKYRTPGLAIRVSALLILLPAGVMSLRGFNGSDIYDLCGSLSVFGFLTAYGLVALALPFARRAVGQHSNLLAAISIATIIVIVLIGVFDLKSAADPSHARIPYIYLAYISLGLVWYAFTRRRSLPVEP